MYTRPYASPVRCVFGLWCTESYRATKRPACATIHSRRPTRASVQASEENVRVAEQRYKLGVMTIVELMQIQEQLTQAQVNEVQARFTYLRTKAQIEAIVGRRLP